MTAAPPDAPSSTDKPRQEPTSRSVAIPLIVWLLVQLAAIALAASRIPLSANYPRPPQSLAVHVMLIAQFVGSAIFLPVLFRGWRAWLVIVVTAGLMLVVASTMTAVPIGRVMILWGHVATWLTVLAIWRAALPSGTNVLAAVAIFLTAGGLLLAYLRAEFQGATPTGWLQTSPLLAAIASMADSIPLRPPFPSTSAGLIAFGMVILLITRAKRCKNDQPAVNIV